MKSTIAAYKALLDQSSRTNDPVVDSAIDVLDPSIVGPTTAAYPAPLVVMVHPTTKS